MLYFIIFFANKIPFEIPRPQRC